MTANRAASVLARLKNRADAKGEDFQLVLTRFAMERLLARLVAAGYQDTFLLKGALLFNLWYDEPHRPTRDMDLLGSGPDDTELLVQRFREIAATQLDDAVIFDPNTVTAAPIREANAYGGVRVSLMAAIGQTRTPLQVDVAFGDTVTPTPEWADYPALLDDIAAPRVRVYPVYSVIAEKYQAMTTLGLANSRMKDFFDLAYIAAHDDLDGALLAKAIRATFERRKTALPDAPPLAITSAFAKNEDKIKQWRAFMGRSGLGAMELSDAVATLYDLLWPPTVVARDGTDATATWRAASRRWEADIA
ncbi:nucleotidyl transferase AbiEii/AbiGii toxin family protein [Piscinibacterium candidicorallinum]|uniref:Nucleotidyl transferase AbiEii/AbiGii toxin family protein n=1 Tax=Piscinibacterium candidicorallinum TaxID=1793872 RepID=A0ABV7GXQ7_9BURK